MTLLNVLDVLNALNVVNMLNMLDMPKDASKAYLRLRTISYTFLPIGTKFFTPYIT